MGITTSTIQTFTVDEKSAFEHAKRTKRVKKECYEIGIPWRQGEPTFDDNYQLASWGLRMQEKSLHRKDP